MAANSSAHSAKAGFNQSGGAYFIVIETTLANKLFAYTPGTGSGGASGTGAAVAPVTLATLAPGSTPGATSLTLAPGKLIKDMGKSVVVAGVTYRKFQAVVTPSPSAPNGYTSNGQTGRAPEYVSFYLDVGRDGASSAPAGIARYF